MDCSPPGSSVHGIVWARILESVAISFSRGSSRPRNRTQISCITGRWFTNWAMREAQNRYAGTPVYETAGRSTCVIHQQHQSTPALNRFSISISLFPTWGCFPACFFSPFFHLPVFSTFLIDFCFGSLVAASCTSGWFASTKAVGWAPCLPAGGGAQRRKDSCSDPLPLSVLPPPSSGLKPLKVTAVQSLTDALG